MVQSLVQSTVRDGVRSSLRENDKAVALVLSKSDLQSSRFLKVVGENAALKAGVQLVLSYPENVDARRTVEDQLRELCDQMGFEMLLVSGQDGMPLAGVLRANGSVAPLDVKNLKVTRSGLSLLNGVVYQIASEPINQGDENLATLTVGEAFDFSEFTTPTVLLHDGHVLKSSINGVPMPEVESAMARCQGAAECNVNLHGINYMAEPIQSVSFGNGYLLRSLQNLDSAAGPVQQVLKKAFATVAFGAVLIALIVSMASADSIVQPIDTVVEHLKQAEKTGDLAEFEADVSRVQEIRRLIESFNQAAVAIREGRENLTLAYVEFVQSLANALDARDPYTAGHSYRVSEMARAVAAAMNLGPEMVERVRVGALLHDIGKIGIADHLLRKPGRLTGEEFAIVSEHPVIGRRILEGVHGFGPYLPAVELHHENWDGTGYPHGQKAEETPIDARIIHVVDAYDAMTTDRPYRPGMSHEAALRMIQVNAGTQFDPRIVMYFTGSPAIEIAAANRTAAVSAVVTGEAA
jgi:HD-GYP domain-containing protein (c-di-GMP phosphodiesterase class II)